MRKTALLLLILFATTFLQAQTFNLKAGMAISDIKWKNSLLPADIFLKNEVGFNVTLGIDFLQKKYFWVSSEIGYVQVRGSGSIPEDPTDPFLTAKKNCKLQIANCKLQTANSKLQTANCKLQTPYC